MLSPLVALIFWILTLLSVRGVALPPLIEEPPTALNQTITPRECGPVSKFYYQTPRDWVDHDTDKWLDRWIKSHHKEIRDNPAGFAGAFGMWALGNPDWSCRDDGSHRNCDFNPCRDMILEGNELELRQAYYVLEAVTRLHDYYTGVREAFTVSTNYAALGLNKWVTTFYKDKDVDAGIFLKEVFNGFGTVFGMIAAFGALEGGPPAVSLGITSALSGGLSGAITPGLGQHKDDTPKKAAELGDFLGHISAKAVQALTDANNKLMKGENLEDSGDIRSYFAGGSFVNFKGINKNAVTESMNDILLAQVVNALWRPERTFIIGGGACGDNQGIGSGPQEASLCREGKAWYLYHWEPECDVHTDVCAVASPNHGRQDNWGHVEAPRGLGALGNFSSITVADVISSSLDSYEAANYDYTPEMRQSRALSAIRDGWGNPLERGPSWEGIFTIPVCDVSSAVFRDMNPKNEILVPYGKKSAPAWCPRPHHLLSSANVDVCSGSRDQTRAFFKAAHLDDLNQFLFGCVNKRS